MRSTNRTLILARHLLWREQKVSISFLQDKFMYKTTKWSPELFQMDDQPCWFFYLQYMTLLSWIHSWQIKIEIIFWHRILAAATLVPERENCVKRDSLRKASDVFAAKWAKRDTAKVLISPMQWKSTHSWSRGTYISYHPKISPLNRTLRTQE